MLDAIDHLGPLDGEAAVLSSVAVADGGAWTVLCGSLLTVPRGVAFTSWPRWSQLQPQWTAPPTEGGFDLGPTFWAEPFAGVRILRSVIEPGRWPDVIRALGDGYIDAPFARCRVEPSSWSSTVFFGQRGTTDAHRVLTGAERPVTGIFATLQAPPVPPTEDTWSWPLPPNLIPGPDLGSIAPHRRLLHWPIELLGIDWLGHPDHPPKRTLAIGRALTEAWIARVSPDHEAEQLVISIAWDEQHIDPLGCALQLRAEIDGLPAFSRQIRISDLPSSTPADGPEPREMGWSSRTLEVRLPRGPRHSDWGLALLSPDGRLLDERPAVARYESFHITFSFGEHRPGYTSTVGDRAGPPTAAERDDAVRLAVEVEGQARDAAAARRISTSGQMSDYLRWRFACRDGELIVADPFLLGNDPEAAIAVLARMRRQVRALSGGIPEIARQPLAEAADWLEVRALSDGRKSLHDRVWIVGETGLLVGTSVNDLAQAPGRSVRGASTATELPFADAAAWRQQFERWWTRSKPLAVVTRARRNAGQSGAGLA